MKEQTLVRTPRTDTKPKTRHSSVDSAMVYMQHLCTGKQNFSSMRHKSSKSVVGMQFGMRGKIQESHKILTAFIKEKLLRLKGGQICHI
jgi:hypothetical protein